jgi:hypothetical protein
LAGRVRIVDETSAADMVSAEAISLAAAAEAAVDAGEPICVGVEASDE